MPFDSTPRIAATFSTMPLAGTTAPAGPNTPSKPARALGAPQTTCSGSPPESTDRTCSLSACGCGAAVRTRAIRNADSFSAGLSMLSTSWPMRFSISATPWASASVSRCSLSQLSENFMPILLRSMWERPKRQIHNASTSVDRRRRRRAGRPCHISASPTDRRRRQRRILDRHPDQDRRP